MRRSDLAHGREERSRAPEHGIAEERVHASCADAALRRVVGRKERLAERAVGNDQPAPLGGIRDQVPAG